VFPIVRPSVRPLFLPPNPSVSVLRGEILTC
jgi:hypothetical protein